jgi:hypothetical protein
LTKREIGSASWRRFSPWRRSLGQRGAKGSPGRVTDTASGLDSIELSIQLPMTTQWCSSYESRTGRTFTDRPPNTRVPRTRVARCARSGSPLRRRPLGAGDTRKWLGGLVLAATAAVGCRSAATPPAVERPRPTFGNTLSLAISFESALAAGDTSVMTKFALTNNGSEVFNGCFGPAWGLSVIVDGHNAGHAVGADYPKCEERLTLLPRQTIVWSKKIPLSKLRAGLAKVTGWVRVVDPTTCSPQSGCRDVSVASPLMSVPIGER